MAINRRPAPKEIFFNRQSNENLKAQAVQGGGITIITRGLSTLINIGGLVVLARLLTPEDFGLVTMVGVFTNLFFVFNDIGLEDATIQTTEIRHEQISTLFWVNIGIGILITIILITLSPFVAWFYKKPQLTIIMIVSSVSFVFTGMTTQHMALLKRHMLFMKVGIIGITATFLSTLAAIILALIGLGYWAIVLRSILYGAFNWLLAWSYCRWRPSLPKKNTGVRSLIKFGANSVGYYIINWFAANMDKTIVGKYYGAKQLGFYSRAYYLSTMPSGQLTQSLFHVAVSTLSKLREDPESYCRYYLKALSAVSLIGLPLSIFMVVMSKELVYILLGPQWDQAAGLFSILGLGAGLNILYNTNGWLHVSQGRSDRWLKWGIFGSAIMVAGFAIGLLFGPKGVAASYSISIILLTFPSIAYAGKPIGLRMREVFIRIRYYIIAAVLAGIILNYIKNSFIIQEKLILSIAISIVIYTGSYFLFLIALNRGIGPLRELHSLVMITLTGKAIKNKTR